MGGLTRRSLLLSSLLCGSAALIPTKANAQENAIAFAFTAKNPIQYCSDVSLALVRTDHTIKAAKARATRTLCNCSPGIRFPSSLQIPHHVATKYL